ncbi:MAG TPA: glycosyl hydrolase, partial [Actinoplanes sp.]|nr:glycosyl hydrolase [Actinoplanes sp.]
DGRPGDLPRCARGEFDSNWRDFGALMVEHGRGDSVVRLGWEFNGDFMSWAGTDPATWIACYRRAVRGIRATNPAAIFDWTINAHHTPAKVCGGVSTGCYPGDDYVDIIGIDNYDHYPPSTTKATFDRVAAAPEGLDWLYAFARRHGKLFAVGEWGVAAGSTVGGGDNADFIRWMHGWFAAHAEHLAYEAYYSGCTESPLQSSLFRTDAGCLRNPRSAAAYRELFGS